MPHIRVAGLLPQASAKHEDMSETKTTPEAEAPEVQDAAQQDPTTEQAAAAEESTAEEAATEEEQAVPETDWHDQYLRLYAEFDNYRKRTMRERVELTRSAGREILEKLLPVVDDFERGLKVETEDIAAVREGQNLVYTKLVQLLQGQGLHSLNVQPGDDFDTDLCEAITNIPHPELKGKVVDVIEQGYKLHDTVVRFAKVVVGA